MLLRWPAATAKAAICGVGSLYCIQLPLTVIRERLHCRCTNQGRNSCHQTAFTALTCGNAHFRQTQSECSWCNLWLEVWYAPLCILPSPPRHRPWTSGSRSVEPAARHCCGDEGRYAGPCCCCSARGTIRPPAPRLRCPQPAARGPSTMPSPEVCHPAGADSRAVCVWCCSTKCTRRLITSGDIGCSLTQQSAPIRASLTI